MPATPRAGPATAFSFASTPRQAANGLRRHGIVSDLAEQDMHALLICARGESRAAESTDALYAPICVAYRRGRFRRYYHVVSFRRYAFRRDLARTSFRAIGVSRPGRSPPQQRKYPELASYELLH